MYQSLIFRQPITLMASKISCYLSLSFFLYLVSMIFMPVMAASLSDVSYQSRSLTLKSDQPISAPRWNVWDSILGKEKTKLFVIDLPGVRELSPEGAVATRGILKNNSAIKKLMCRPAGQGVMRVYFEVAADSVGQMAPVLKFKNNNEVSIQFQSVTRVTQAPTEAQKTPTKTANKSETGKIKLLSTGTSPQQSNAIAKISPALNSPKITTPAKISNQPIYPSGQAFAGNALTAKPENNASSQSGTLTIKNDQGQFETLSMISLIERQSKKITELEAHITESKLKEASQSKSSQNELVLQRQVRELSQDNDILKAQLQRLETELAVKQQQERLASQPTFIKPPEPSSQEPLAMMQVASPILSQPPIAISPPQVGQAVTLTPSSKPSAQPGIVSQNKTGAATRERVVVIEQKAKEKSSGSAESNKIAQWLQNRKGKSPFSGLTISPQKMLNGVGPSAQFTLKRKRDEDSTTPKELIKRTEAAANDANFLTVMEPHSMDDPALKALKSSLKSQPNSVGTYYQIASVYKQQGELSKAIDVLKTLVRSEPTQSKAYLELVDLNLATGKPLDAHVYLDEYKKLNPQDTQSITSLQNRINLAMNSFIQTMESQK